MSNENLMPVNIRISILSLISYTQFTDSKINAEHEYMTRFFPCVQYGREHVYMYIYTHI